MALMRERGKEVIYVTVTDGGMGTFDPELSPGELVVIRRREAQEAASVLGADKHIFLGYPDTDVLSHRELREKFIKLLREEKPDGILLPDPWLPYEAHLGMGMRSLAFIWFADLLFQEFYPFPHQRIKIDRDKR
ncbi:diacetylchitobiose deacetylase [Candidatus Hakubella thermalkaliphila]|uniref:Diacetylchitobiose deacetylase n=1 Tax=Candidatus Hakubella thermalkaliphila TaxID=2754717 RepID=A0A6V8NMW9_9ACTN|nr:diacetylchitobiose deacetylase [Candidatus Hakubella thermalkaliphila]